MENSTDIPYQKLSTHRIRWWTRVVAWFRRDHHKVHPMHTAVDARHRMQRSIRQINLAIQYYKTQLERVEVRARNYLRQGDEDRARAEVKVYMHLQDTRQIMCAIHTKHRVLLEEMKKMDMLNKCMDHMVRGVDALDVQLRQINITDIDRVMSTWDTQLKDARQVGDAMVQMSPAQRMTHSADDETNPASLLASWRLDELDQFDQSNQSNQSDQSEHDTRPTRARDSRVARSPLGE